MKYIVEFEDEPCMRTKCIFTNAFRHRGGV